jgi:hypothetical protein
MKRSNDRRAAKAAPHRNGTASASRNGAAVSQAEAFRLKVGLAEMLKGGVIMDVMNVEQAVIAQESGAAAVMALERIPSQIRKAGGVARMSDPSMIAAIRARSTSRSWPSAASGIWSRRRSSRRSRSTSSTSPRC